MTLGKLLVVVIAVDGYPLVSPLPDLTIMVVVVGGAIEDEFLLLEHLVSPPLLNNIQKSTIEIVVFLVDQPPPSSSFYPAMRGSHPAHQVMTTRHHASFLPFACPSTLCGGQHPFS
uniref:Secreted protein n=2 Tax=Ditylenchus dipsaci TaxID=166011 RepID=A0A915CSL6_9BILA